MSNSAFTTIEVSELHHVSGGQGEGAAVARGAARTGARVASRAIPVVGQVITAADAGYSAYTDYNRARAQGQTVLQSTGQGALGALNSLTFGASNWLLGRN